MDPTAGVEPVPAAVAADVRVLPHTRPRPGSAHAEDVDERSPRDGRRRSCEARPRGLRSYLRPGTPRSRYLEGNGQQVYEATPAAGAPNTLEWILRDSTAELIEIKPVDAGDRRSMEVRHSNGSSWSASDGSAIVGEIDKRQAAPEAIDTDWLLYKVTKDEGQGFLSRVTYVRKVFTHAGRPPAARPTRRGERVSVAYRRRTGCTASVRLRAVAYKTTDATLVTGENASVQAEDDVRSGVPARAADRRPLLRGSRGPRVRVHRCRNPHAESFFEELVGRRGPRSAR